MIKPVQFEMPGSYLEQNRSSLPVNLERLVRCKVMNYCGEFDVGTVLLFAIPLMQSLHAINHSFSVN